MESITAQPGVEVLGPMPTAPVGEAIFLARAPGLVGSDRIVAARHVSLEGDAKALEILRTAADHARRLRHEHIAAFLGMARTAGGAWLLSEPLDGPSLRKVIDDTRAAGRALTPLTVVQVARPICAALHHGHAEAAAPDGRLLQMPHGRLSPSVAFIGKGGRVRVSEFWMGWVTARLHAEELTAYASPSQARREPPSIYDDVFSMGAMLFELLTLEPLLWPDNLDRTRAALLDGSWAARVDRLSATSAPGGLDAVVRRCLERDPGRRYASALSLLKALSRCYAALRGDGQPAPVRHPAPARKAEPVELDPDLVETQEMSRGDVAGQQGQNQAAEGDVAASLTQAELADDAEPEEPAAAEAALADTQAALAAATAAEGARWDGASEGGEAVAGWWDGAARADTWDGASEGGVAVADWWSATEGVGDGLPMEDDPTLDIEARRAVKRSAAPWVVVLVVLALAAAGWWFVREYLPDEDQFRIERMEERLGVKGEGELPQRLAHLEALAGKRRDGSLAFRAEHLESELAVIIQEVEGELALGEAYFGLEPRIVVKRRAFALPVVPRLERLEMRLFGEVQTRPRPWHPSGRAPAMVERSDTVVAAIAGRAMHADALARCLSGEAAACIVEGLPEGKGASPPEEAAPRRASSTVPELLKRAEITSEQLWRDHPPNSLPMLTLPASTEARLSSVAVDSWAVGQSP